MYSQILRRTLFGADYVQMPVRVGRLILNEVPFRAENHLIISALLDYTEQLPDSDQLALKDIAEMAGIGEHAVVRTGKARLSSLFTEE